MKHHYVTTLKNIAVPGGNYLPAKGYSADSSDLSGKLPETVVAEKALAVLPEDERKNYVVNIQHMGVFDE
jgi:hypothetical protein